MKYFKKIVGENLYLSPMNILDAEQYCKWLNDISVNKYLGGSCKSISIESEKEYIENTNKNDRYQFAIIRKEDDKLLGNCGFNEVNLINRVGTLGIFIGDEENRNKGYGFEILNMLLDYGFNYLNLNNIMLGVYSFNERAIACYKKTGFKEIGRRREAYYLNGKYYDIISMDYLKKEYKK